MTRAIAPVAAEIIAGRPPVKAIVTAMVKEANSPTLGSTPARIENEIASGMSASATTRPAKTSVRSRRGEEKAYLNDARTPTGARSSSELAGGGDEAPDAWVGAVTGVFLTVEGT